MSRTSHQRRPLTDTQLDRLLPRDRLEALSLRRFGGVMLTAEVESGRRKVDIMFRQEPDPRLPFSGWVFLSSEEAIDASVEQRGLALHDSRAILRIAPEVAPYLDLPPGTRLIRTGERTFREDTDG